MIEERQNVPEYRKTVPLSIKKRVWDRLSLNLQNAITSATYGTVLHFPDGRIFHWIYRERYGLLENRIRAELKGSSDGVG